MKIVKPVFQCDQKHISLTLNSSINFDFFFLNSGPLDDKFGSGCPFQAVLFIKLTTVNLHTEQLSVKKSKYCPTDSGLPLTRGLHYLLPYHLCFCSNSYLFSTNLYLLCSTYTSCPRLLSFSRLSVLLFYSLWRKFL